MYVYRKAHMESVFTVGYYDPQGKWQPESDWMTRSEAAARVSYLNGGNNALTDNKG